MTSSPILMARPLLSFLPTQIPTSSAACKGFTETRPEALSHRNTILNTKTVRWTNTIGQRSRLPTCVRSVFIKYLRGDLSWLSDFRWEKMSRKDLGQERFALNSTFTPPHGRLATEEDEHRESKNWIVVAFTVLAYGTQAPFYAGHPYRAIGDLDSEHSLLK